MKKIKVFLCYAKRDKTIVAELFDFLSSRGVEPWMDKRNLVLADDWESEIRRAVARADAVIVCLRPHFNRIGFRQKEVRWALDEWKKRPPGAVFMVPFILKPCTLPEWVSQFMLVTCRCALSSMKSYVP